jgi:GntR family galactonate operon transcriptional repressor
MSTQSNTLSSSGRRSALGDVLVDRIGQRVVRAVLAGDTDPFTEKSLEIEFEVSRTAVREAIKILSAKGLVETRQKIGVRSRRSSEWNLFDRDVLRWVLADGRDPAAVAQLIEVRRLIEPQAACFAAERRSDEEALAIEAAARRMHEKANDLAKFNDADMAFHIALFAATQNDYLICLGRSISGALLGAFEISASSSERAIASAEKHLRVAAAVLARDGAAASAAMMAIIDQSASDLAMGLASRRNGTD